MTFCRTVSAFGTKRRRETVYHSSGRTCHQVGLAHVRLDDRRSACDHPASCSPRAEVRRRLQSDAPRRPRQHVDPRGGDILRHRPDDGGLQQSRPLRSACAAKQPGDNPAGACDGMDSGRGRHVTDVQAPPGRQGHEGKPFTTADVKCTWDLLAGCAQDRLRTNPRAAWYENLAEVKTNGDYAVTFRLKQRQAAFIALLASGYSLVYPCHVPAKDMRVFPIGTGPKHTP